MSAKNITRSEIMAQSIEILKQSETPLHYEEISKRIAWKPEPGAKTHPGYTVYQYLYENAVVLPKSEGGKVITFHKRGVFGLAEKTYSAEQVGAAVPARRTAPKVTVPEGHRVAFIPEGVDPKVLAKLGIVLG